MSTTLHSIVGQNAATSTCLGVDFVPVFRSTRHGATVEVSEPLSTDVSTKPGSDGRTSVPLTGRSGSPLLDAANSPSPPRPARSTPTRTEPSTERPRSPVNKAPDSTARRTHDEPHYVPDDEALSDAAASASDRSATRPPDVYIPAKPHPTWNDQQRAAFDRLEAIRKRYIDDAPHANFVTDHHRIVFGDGDPCARLMFIGEAPGADEDKAGIPFVGRAGQLLNKMIVAMGLTRPQVYIANVLKTRPPNNATPTLEEAQLCAPYLFDQVAAVSPLVVVTLGLPATKLVLKTDQSMSALRGRWASFVHKGFTVPVMPTYHPAYLLRAYTPDNRAKVWSDLQKAMSRLGGVAGQPPAAEMTSI